MNDSLGNRMKFYEGLEAGRMLMPLLPSLVRLDGKNFHSLTDGLARPFDARFSAVMIDVTKSLVAETGARIGHTQSDEISLVLYSDNIKSQIYFNGKVFKIISVLAAFTSLAFNAISRNIPELRDRLALFDCRVWNVPTLEEAVNVLVWRELDATKNSISMAARSVFPHSQLINKTGPEMQAMLFDRGINWNDYPSFFKRGTYIQRRRIIKRLPQEELDSLPPLHEARRNPNLEIERSEIRLLEMPPIPTVVNRVDVVFNGADPILGSPQ